MPAGIKVVGLKELRSALKETDLSLKDLNYEAAEYIRVRAVERASGVSRLAARGARSLKASRSGVAARVTIGGPGAPEAPGSEFGSIHHHQFPPWQGNGEGAGYYLWPTIREKTPELVDLYADGVMKLLHPAFPS